MSDLSLKPVDHAALKVNQITIILLNLFAFILNAPWLAAADAGFMLVGTALGLPGFVVIYRYFARKYGLIKPEIILDNAEPHRFAQGFGGVVMLAGSIALFAGSTVLGWGLVWLVIALAALNAFGGFCAGCFVYYWLGRLHVPGFVKAPPAGTFPGLKPR